MCTGNKAGTRTVKPRRRVHRSAVLRYGAVRRTYALLLHLASETYGAGLPGLEQHTTRHDEELTGNQTAARDLSHFAEGLATVYTRMARALKPGAPLLFTYHHNQREAYLAVAMAVLDSGLTCSASLPCPAEMGGSIHIHGTGSSIVDTVFVCRDSDVTPRVWLFDDADGLARIMDKELAELRAAGHETYGGRYPVYDSTGTSPG